MKYSYKYYNNNTIDNYTINGNKIIVTFLDGSIKEIEYNTDNEKKILNLMLNQAIERSQSVALSKAKYKKIDALLSLGLCAIWVAVLINSIIFYNNKKFNIIGSIGTGIDSGFLVYYINKFINSIKEIDEIKKYNLYLDLKENLDNINNDNSYNYYLYNGKGDLNLVNINTLDNFSLKEIKNIKKIIENSNFFIIDKYNNLENNIEVTPIYYKNKKI